MHLLSGPAALKKFLLGFSLNPPPPLLRSLSCGSAATVILKLQSRLERQWYKTLNDPHSVKSLQMLVAGIQMFITYNSFIKTV